MLNWIRSRFFDADVPMRPRRLGAELVSRGQYAEAIEVLEKGLSRVRQDAKLLKVRDEIGYRTSPSLRFLRRTNPVNKLYSRCAKLLLMPVKLGAVLALLRLS